MLVYLNQLINDFCTKLGARWWVPTAGRDAMGIPLAALGVSRTSLITFIIIWTLLGVCLYSVWQYLEVQIDLLRIEIQRVAMNCLSGACTRQVSRRLQVASKLHGNPSHIVETCWNDNAALQRGHLFPTENQSKNQILRTDPKKLKDRCSIMNPKSIAATMPTWSPVPAAS